MGQEEQGALVDALYGVALEPARYDELVEYWQGALARAESGAAPRRADLEREARAHLGRAAQILETLGSSDALPPSPQQRVDAEAQATLAVHADGRIAAVNAAARSHYRVEEGDPLTALPLTDHAAAELTRAVRVRAGTGPRAEPELLRLDRSRGDGVLVLTVTRWDAADGTPLVLLRSTDFLWPEGLTPLVARSFGLTEAESEVVRLIVEGASVEEVARLRSRSLATVRSQIRSIYEKTATRSQTEFIRMAIGLTTLSFARSGDGFKTEAPPGDDRPLPEHRRLLTLPDGRTLDYADFGAADGRPVLYFHNALCGDVWPAELAARARARGLRILAPARPGFARSSPYPDGVDHRAQTAEDLCVLLDALGLERVVAVAQTWGVVFALGLARHAPERLDALVGIAPSLPHGAPEDEAAMPRYFRFVSSLVMRHPELLEFAIRAGLRHVDRVGERRFLERVFRHAPADLAVIRDPAHAAGLRRGLAYGRAHGARAVLDDYRQVPTDAADVLRTLPCPFLAVIGEEDRNSRRQRAERLVAAGAPLELRLVPGGGQLLFHSHPDAVLAAIEDGFEAAAGR
ncbi:MAG: alpha/beta fold hydrolase [Pseudomonadales bacterium]|jgi:pimeloyl-ACP methyl ester carboxylesterase/DNA-binding CsgD family transcriptional regulator|nr:alpha/beta fold hydrolase [Pseudomonadales bacterium]